MTRAAVRVVLLAGLALLIGAEARAAEQGTSLVIAARVDATAPVHIGDVVTLSIDVTGEGARDATLPPAPDLGSFELLGEPARDVIEDSAGRPAVRMTLRVQPFAVGSQRIPSITLVSGRTGAALAVRTDPVSIPVEPLTTAGTPPSAVKLVLPPVKSEPLVPVVLAGLVVSALAYRSAMRLAGRDAPGELALIRSLVRRGSRPDGDRDAINDVRSAAERALGSIDGLIDRARAQYDPAPMHQALAAAIVRYVETSRRLEPRERTTSELLAAARRRDRAANVAAVASVLHVCDLVKFARLEPTGPEFVELARVFETFVRADESPATSDPD